MNANEAARIIAEITEAQNSLPAVVTQRTAHRGQRIEVQTTDGQTITGTVIGWGAYRLTLCTEPDGRWREISTHRVASATKQLDYED